MHDAPDLYVTLHIAGKCLSVPGILCNPFWCMLWQYMSYEKAVNRKPTIRFAYKRIVRLRLWSGNGLKNSMSCMARGSALFTSC